MRHLRSNALPLDQVPSMEGALLRAQKRGTLVSSFIDVGASDGRWSLLAMKYFPSSQYMLVEAQSIHQPSLEKCSAKRANTSYLISAAGDTVGEIYFDASDPFGGRADRVPVEHNCLKVPVTTVDRIARDHNLAPPYCIKLDTHGFEVPILEGAVEVLKDTNLVVVECYNFRLPGALVLHEMCAYLQGLGFRCVDLVDQLYRPNDGALWQADLFFAPATAEEFQQSTYEVKNASYR